MSAPTTFEQWMANANECLATQAAAAYENAHKLKTDDSHCLYQWGRALFTLAEFVVVEEEGVEKKLELSTDAIEKLEQAEKLSPDNADILYHLGQALAIKCDLFVDELDDTEGGTPLMEKAIELYERAYPLREQQIASGAVDAKGEAYTNGHLIDIVIAVVQSITSLGCMESTSEEAKKKFEDSVGRIARALDLDASRRAELLQEWANVLQAQASYRQDQSGELNASFYEPAIAKLEEAIAADEKRTEAIVDLAELYLSLAHGRLAEASIGNEEDDEEDEEDEEKITAIIDARIAAAEPDIVPHYEKAIQQFERAVSVDSENSALHVYLGDAIFGRSQLPLPSSKANENELLASAEKNYRTALKLEKERDESAVLLRLAQSVFFLKRADECSTLLDQWKEGGSGLETLYEADDILEREFIEHIFEKFEADIEDDDEDEDFEDEE
ncbi:hypothetical protein BDF19DRAFT_435364 [Syncephalis fuscata]|nr:hypothetical protein BDF19DRAFT_435364 [Syncephalis fuscata]